VTGKVDPSVSSSESRIPIILALLDHTHPMPYNYITVDVNFTKITFLI
jgi:hypothetical protein